MSTRLTTWAYEIVTEMRTIAETLIVRPVSPQRFQVIGGGLKEGLVDLQKKTCSCTVFQLDQLVCGRRTILISHVNIHSIVIRGLSIRQDEHIKQLSN